MRGEIRESRERMSREETKGKGRAESRAESREQMRGKSRAETREWRCEMAEAMLLMSCRQQGVLLYVVEDRVEAAIAGIKAAAPWGSKSLSPAHGVCFVDHLRRTKAAHGNQRLILLPPQKGR